MPEAEGNNDLSEATEDNITNGSLETYNTPGEIEIVIAQLRTKIQEHGILLSQSRKRTEITLVHPILNYMDWDTSDPALALPNYEGAHYTLVWQSETKALLTSRTLTETTSYNGDGKIDICNRNRTPHLLITNGDRWILRNALIPTPKPLSCRISDESLSDTAQTLRKIFATIG